MDEPAKRMKMDSNEYRILTHLPDEILDKIFSNLPSKEYVRTTLLAKKWKNRWKLSIKHLSIIYPTLEFVKKSSIDGRKVDGLYVQEILSNCIVLEEFRLVRSDVDKVLTISSKSLKKLEIIGCGKLKTLQLNAPKLASFKYNGPDTGFVFCNVPSLVEVSFVGIYCKHVTRRKFSQFEPILEQLERINLILDKPWIYHFPRIEGFKNIKKVRLDIRIRDYRQPLQLFGYIIQALPYLEVFTLGLYWHPEPEGMITDLSGVSSHL